MRVIYIYFCYLFSETFYFMFMIMLSENVMNHKALSIAVYQIQCSLVTYGNQQEEIEGQSICRCRWSTMESIRTAWLLYL